MANYYKLCHPLCDRLFLSLNKLQCRLSSSTSASSLHLQNPKSLSLITNSINKNKNHFLYYTSCEQIQNTTHHQVVSNRTHFFATIITASGLTSSTQAIMASGSPNKQESSSSSSSPDNHKTETHQIMQLQKCEEFGSEPKPLKSPVRVLVPKPKRSKKEEATDVLVVEGIDIPNDGPVRFDVYVAKTQGNGGDEVGPDLGEFAGSMVDLARIRAGRSPPKGSLELGISYLLEEIGAQNCDNVAVTILPRSGEVTVGGVHIDLVPYS